MPSRVTRLISVAGPQLTAVAAVMLVATAGAFAIPVTPLDLEALDLGLSALPRAPASVPITVIGIDERSVREIPEPVALWHRTFATLLHGMRHGDARAIGLDVSLPERSFAQIVPGLDEALIGALLETRGALPTVLALTVDASGTTRPLNPAIVAAAGTVPGFALWPVDRDGVVRRYDDALGQDGRRVETFVASLARAAGIAPEPGYIDFSVGKPFDYVPLIDVLDQERKGNSAWLRERFKDRVVLLGSTLPFEDVVRTPVQLASFRDPSSPTPGVLLHAQALRSFAGSRAIHPLSPWATALLAVACCLLPVLVRSPASGAPALGGALLLIALISVAALTRKLFVPVSWPMLGAVASFTAWHGVAVATSLAERRRLRESFGRYVSPSVLENILAGRIHPQAGGSRRFVCALFSDMRNYTPRSERMTPEQNIAFLNRYFERVVGIIHDAGGTVMSFAGDGIMAIFGAPQDLANPCEAAFMAARNMLDFLPRFNAELAREGIEPLEIGIGLHAGSAIVGHVGSASRHDYTAIGDAINVASRLEGATKEVRFRLVCSREVASRLGGDAALVALGPVGIKGHTAVDAYGHSALERDRAGPHRSRFAPKDEVSHDASG